MDALFYYICPWHMYSWYTCSSETTFQASVSDHRPSITVLPFTRFHSAWMTCSSQNVIAWSINWSCHWLQYIFKLLDQILELLCTITGLPLRACFLQCDSRSSITYWKKRLYEMFLGPCVERRWTDTLSSHLPQPQRAYSSNIVAVTFTAQDIYESIQKQVGLPLCMKC